MKLIIHTKFNQIMDMRIEGGIYVFVYPRVFDIPPNDMCL